MPGGGGSHEDPPMFGEKPGDGRELRSLGFAAFFTGEFDALELVSKAERLTGVRMTKARRYEVMMAQGCRYFSEKEIASALAGPNLPTERQWDENGPPWESLPACVECGRKHRPELDCPKG